MHILKRINKDVVSGSDTFKVYIMPASADEFCISIHDEYPATAADTADNIPIERTFRCRLNGQMVAFTQQSYFLSEGDNYRSQKVIYHLLVNLSEISDEGVMYLLELFVLENERSEPICLEEFVLDDAFNGNEDDFEEVEIIPEREGTLPAKSADLMENLNVLIESNHRLTNQLSNLASHLRGIINTGRKKTAAKPAVKSGDKKTSAKPAASR